MKSLRFWTQTQNCTLIDVSLTVSPVRDRTGRVIGASKIVLNGAIDMAGTDRGNMRCFEAMGCGALLLSDAGKYPDGIDRASTMLTYDTGADCVAQIESSLLNCNETKSRADRGRSKVRQLYSKEVQWAQFGKLLERL